MDTNQGRCPVQWSYLAWLVLLKALEALREGRTLLSKSRLVREAKRDTRLVIAWFAIVTRFVPCK